MKQERAIGLAVGACVLLAVGSFVADRRYSSAPADSDPAREARRDRTLVPSSRTPADPSGGPGGTDPGERSLSSDAAFVPDLPPVPTLPPRDGRATVDIVGLDATRDVTDLVRMRASALRRCYEDRLSDRPDAAGEIDVRVSIDARGLVSDARAVRDTAADDALTDCVLGVVRRLRRPEGAPTEPVTIGLRFTPRSH